MKNIVTKSFAILAAGFLLGACEKNTIEEHFAPFESGAHIKMIHAAQDAPMVNMYLGNEKVTALAPTVTITDTIITGLSYAGTAVFPASYGYANVPAGNYNVQMIDTTSKKGSAVVVSTASVNLNDKTPYSAFLIGTTGAFETLLIEDKLPEGNYSKAYIRFVNVMAGAPANFDMSAVRKATADKPSTTTVIGTNVAYKGNTAYVEIEPGTYDFPIYVSGSTTAYTTMTGVAPTAGRVYTLYTRGNYTNKPATTNRVLVRDR
ncbi:DUF4397 domain-containing protein [Pontibacter vulgaris]|uniref:DUF4397 domain-containing protein n=1 Tax=Pontibacter vulgaris TaxID=2905679 RepID=UPI001FA71EE2|nr:DUF4397 domain-containing protein [Pontibacter vulgaris]